MKYLFKGKKQKIIRPQLATKLFVIQITIELRA
jgi:SAM-dependent methyltransferase